MEVYWIAAHSALVFHFGITAHREKKSTNKYFFNVVLCVSQLICIVLWLIWLIEGGGTNM